MKTLRAIVACLMAFTIVFSAVSIISRTELFSGVKNTVAEGVNNVTETFGDMDNATLENLIKNVSKGDEATVEALGVGSTSMSKDNLTELLIEQLTESKTDDVSFDSETLLENLESDGSFKVPFDEIYPEAISEGIVEFNDTSLLIKKSKDNAGISFDMIWAGVAKLEVLFEMENDIWYTAKLIKGVDVTKTVEKLRALKEVKSVDYDYKMQTTAMAQAAEIPEIMCNNEKISDQWYMKYCGIPSGFGSLTKLGGSSDVVVAVIDTGVDFDHKDLKNNIWVNKNEVPNNGIDDDNNGYVDDYYGVNVVSGKGNGDDDNGHGTHVAGIIAAENNLIGTVGIAFKTKIMPVKAAASNGMFLQSDIAKAILYAYENGAEVINMSFGGSACSQAVQDALSVAYSRCVLVASAGNDGKPNEYYEGCTEAILPNYPAALDYVLGVMSVGALGVESLFTNYDGVNYSPVEYELYAPGEAIVSTIPNDKYASWSGTSMAAPVVSAIAAILRAEYEDRDTYPTKFIYGQLASTSGDSGVCLYPLNHSAEHNTPNIVNLYDALSKTPTPNIQLKDYAIFDTVGFEYDTAGKNNGDGVIDSGETIALGLTLVNQWGMSKDTTVTIDTLTVAGMTDPYIEIVNPTVNYGSVGTYSKKDCGKIYTDEMLTGWENPFYIKVSNDCPNDYVFTLNVNFTSKNGLNDKDNTIYKNDEDKPIKIQLSVRNGVVLPNIIEEDTVLTKDNLYIAQSTTLIPRGVTVRVEPGTHIQFWSNDATDPYADEYIAMIEVEGRFLAQGTAEENIYIYPSELMWDYNVDIHSVEDGVVMLEYAEITNLAPNSASGTANISYNEYSLVNYISNCVLKMNEPENSNLKYRHLFNGNVMEGAGGWPVYIENAIDTVFYKWIRSIQVSGDFNNCAFIDCENGFELSSSNYFNSKNTLFLSGEIGDIDNTYSWQRIFIKEETQNLADTIKSTYYCEDTDTTYFTCRMNDGTARFNININPIYEYVKSLGGDFLKIETEEEAEWLSTKFQRRGYKIGLKYDFENESYTWADGTSLPAFLEKDGLTNQFFGSSIYYDVKNHSLSNDFFEAADVNERRASGFFLFEVKGNYTNETSGDSTVIKEKITELEKEYQLNPYFEGNAILNNTKSDTNRNNWYRVVAPEMGAETIVPLKNNYWGTTNEELIKLQMIDGNDYTNYARFNYTPYLTEAPENTFPFVTDVTILNKDGEEITTVGNEEITVRVEFNRDMDTTIPLNVSFGSSQPYGEYTIDGEYKDARTWEGTYLLTTLIENGSQFFKIGNGCAKGTTYKLYDDVARFTFELDTTAAQSMLMQGEPTDTGINLTWYQDDFETLVGYNVYRSTSEDGYYQKVNATMIPVGEEEFFDGGVEPGQVYYYNFTVVKSDLSESLPSGKIVIQAKDTMSPNIYHSTPGTAFMGENLILGATITDNLAIQTAKLYYRTVGATEWKVSVMNKLNDKYSSIISSTEITTAGLEYYIEAFDGLNYTYSGNQTNPYTIVVREAVSSTSLGDVNGDGSITNIDALMILQAANDQLNLDASQFARADLDGDGSLTAAEALRILHYVSGKVNSVAM